MGKEPELDDTRPSVENMETESDCSSSEGENGHERKKGYFAFQPFTCFSKSFACQLFLTACCSFFIQVCVKEIPLVRC